MSSFPLFDMILSEIDQNDNQLTFMDKETLCERVKKFDEEGYELMYALIKCYAVKYTDDFSSPPFAAKKCKGGYKFDMTNLPDRLIIILYHFVDKHDKKLQEELLRQRV